MPKSTNFAHFLGGYHDPSSFQSSWMHNMAEPASPAQPHGGRKSAVVAILEQGDGLAHIMVSTLLLLLAVGILVASTINFVNDVRLLPNLNEFSRNGLHYLSELLFAVIVLELLSTILTYIHARNLEATIKDFLIVGLISSVRKILLTGAESSINEKASGNAYINEAIGTVITIVGILLLIGGLLLLDMRRRYAVSLSADSSR